MGNRWDISPAQPSFTRLLATVLNDTFILRICDPSSYHIVSLPYRSCLTYHRARLLLTSNPLPLQTHASL
jgi:hypothetical protein